MASQQPPAMMITNEALKDMAMAKVYKSCERVINSADFHSDGELCVAASDDESINVFNMVTGENEKTLYSKKYGVDLIRFTHDPTSVISASKNQFDHTIRYLSIRTNQYLRYFKGHRAPLASLALNPKSDQFISTSLDGSARLWDLRSAACGARVPVGGRSVANFDPSGAVFALACGDYFLRMYDIRMPDRGPFTSTDCAPMLRQAGIEPDIGEPMVWGEMSFTPDGSRLALLDRDPADGHTRCALLLDAYTGEMVTHFVSAAGHPLMPTVTFTPDAQFAAIGTQDGFVCAFNAHSGEQVAEWGQHAGPVNVVRFSPKYFTAFSACQNGVAWLPRRSHVPAPPVVGETPYVP